MFGSKQRKHERQMQEMANQANLEIHQMDNNFNERMAEKANQWNIEQWNREVAQQDLNWKRDAEYNSASAQVERYREAGLNPIIMMQGQGAGSATSQNVPHVSSSQASSGSPIPMEAAHQTFYTPKDILEPLQNSFNSFVDNNLKMEQVQGIKLENQRKQHQMIYDLQSAANNAKSSGEEARLKKISADLADQAFDYNLQTEKYNAETAKYLSEEKKQVAKYQKAIAEGIDERLAAELAKLKFDSSLPFEKYIQAIEKAGFINDSKGVIGALKSISDFLGLNTQALIHYFQNRKAYQEQGLPPQFTGFREDF